MAEYGRGAKSGGLKTSMSKIASVANTKIARNPGTPHKK
jgi:hypothetical protein